MNKTNSRYTALLIIFIFYTFVILSIGFLSTNKSRAQELSNINQKGKSLRELAQERDVELTVCREYQEEYSLEMLAKSEAIVQGRIIREEVTLETDSLYTIYTVETQRIIKPFVSGVPLEFYQLLNKARPEPIGAVFKITRAGGSIIVSGHRISDKVPGQNELIENKDFIFFLFWNGIYKTYSLAGGISGVVSIQDDLQVKSLAENDEVKQWNDIFFKKSRNLGDFLESLKKWMPE